MLRGPGTEAHFDLGIATQNLLLGAAESGLFGCRIGAFSPGLVQRLLQLGEIFKVLLVVALGYPAETVVLKESASMATSAIGTTNRGTPCAQTKACGNTSRAAGGCVSRVDMLQLLGLFSLVTFVGSLIAVPWSTADAAGVFPHSLAEPEHFAGIQLLGW